MSTSNIVNIGGFVIIVALIGVITALAAQQHDQRRRRARVPRPDRRSRTRHPRPRPRRPSRHRRDRHRCRRSRRTADRGKAVTDLKLEETPGNHPASATSTSRPTSPPP